MKVAAMEFVYGIGLKRESISTVFCAGNTELTSAEFRVLNADVIAVGQVIETIDGFAAVATIGAFRTATGAMYMG